MRKQHFIVITVLLSLLVISCGKQGPQRPSRWLGKEPELDSTEMALLELNRQMALAADEQLLQLAQLQEEPYALYDGGIWVHQIDGGDTDSPAIQFGELCTIRIRTYNLDGRMLTDTEQTYPIGKFEMPMGVERNIREWHHGARLRMYAPWYSAYGMKGTDHIAPYENVILEIDIR